MAHPTDDEELGSTDLVLMDDDLGDDAKPALPTYATIADVLEKKNGSGLRLAGWTVARTAMIMPGMLVVGIKPKTAFVGSLISSTLISVFTMVRIYNAGFEEEKRAWEKKQSKKREHAWSGAGYARRTRRR